MIKALSIQVRVHLKLLNNLSIMQIIYSECTLSHIALLQWHLLSNVYTWLYLELSVKINKINRL